MYLEPNQIDTVCEKPRPNTYKMSQYDSVFCDFDDSVFLVSLQFHTYYIIKINLDIQ